jgi:hypothetical protein
LTVKWVQQVMHDCWRDSKQANPTRSRVGRKIFNPWRNHTFPREPAVLSSDRQCARANSRSKPPAQRPRERAGRVSR